MPNNLADTLNLFPDDVTVGMLIIELNAVRNQGMTANRALGLAVERIATERAAEALREKRLNTFGPLRAKFEHQCEVMSKGMTVKQLDNQPRYMPPPTAFAGTVEEYTALGETLVAESEAFAKKAKAERSVAYQARKNKA